MSINYKNTTNTESQLEKKCIHCSAVRKISKIGATRCLNLRLKCTEFDPIAVFKGPTSKGRERGGEFPRFFYPTLITDDADNNDDA